MFFFTFAQHPDRVIAERVANAIQERGLGSVKISSYMGEVTLEGSVSSEEDKLAVEHLALSIEGVKKVKSRIQVNPVTRASITECSSPNLIGKLSGKATLNLICTADTVEINGSIEYPWDESTIFELVQNSNPGKKVVSRLEVLKRLDDQTIYEEVKKALKENGHPLDNITFEVRGRVVYFTGSTDNHRIIDAILATTLMVEGVKEVKSNVKIVKTS